MHAYACACVFICAYMLFTATESDFFRCWFCEGVVCLMFEAYNQWCSETSRFIVEDTLGGV